MTAPLAFLDCETTGLDPAIHDIWELAIIRGTDTWVWHFRPSLEFATPDALRINRFYERTESTDWSPLSEARTVARILTGCQLVGAVPSFDAAFLERFLRKNFQVPTWHHRLRCVETLTAGRLGHEIGGLRDCAEALELPYDRDSLHTALGDARLAKSIYEAVMAP